MVSSKGMLVKSEVTSKLAITISLSNFSRSNSLTNENMSCVVYWLVKIGRSKGTRNLASGKE